MDQQELSVAQFGSRAAAYLESPVHAKAPTSTGCESLPKRHAPLGFWT